MTLINRFLQIMNFLGVAALAVLAGFQWQANSRLAVRADQLDRTRLEQATQLQEQQKTIDQATADADRLHQQLSKSEAAQTDDDAKLAAAYAERDRLRQTLTAWQSALAARDAALKHAADEVQSLAYQRDDAVRRYNSLASVPAKPGT